VAGRREDLQRRVLGPRLLVLLISRISGTHVFDITFAERLPETAIGAGLALTFGVAVPARPRWLTDRPATGQPSTAAQQPINHASPALSICHAVNRS